MFIMKTWNLEIAISTLSQLSARPLSNLMLQTPQLSSTPLWELSQGPCSPLIFCSAISICQWSYGNPGYVRVCFGTKSLWAVKGVFLVISRPALMLLIRGAVTGSEHWAPWWAPAVPPIIPLPTSKWLWVQEDFSIFPTGTQRTACRNDKMLWWMFRDRNSCS